MNADEIREHRPDYAPETRKEFFLAEIAAQLAEMNDRQAGSQKVVPPAPALAQVKKPNSDFSLAPGGEVVCAARSVHARCMPTGGSPACPDAAVAA